MPNNLIICQNKKAYHDYYIEETYECGLELTGTEIKSIRLGKVSIQEAYCYIKSNEVLVSNMHISKYEQGNIFNHDPDREKKLLLHKREILKLNNRIMREGYTLIPLNIHLSNGKAKIDLGVAKGKKLYDKREALKEKAIERDKNKQ